MHIITGCWRGFGRCRGCRLIRWCCCHDPCPLHSRRPDQVGFGDGFWLLHFIVMLRTLSEVKRVLKPGGKFYYMEHIIAPEVSFAFHSFLLKLHWFRAQLFVTCNKDWCLEVYSISICCHLILLLLYLWFQASFEQCKGRQKGIIFKSSRFLDFPGWWLLCWQGHWPGASKQTSLLWKSPSNFCVRREWGERKKERREEEDMRCSRFGWFVNGGEYVWSVKDQQWQGCLK